MTAEQVSSILTSIAGRSGGELVGESGERTIICPPRYASLN
jgi:hypothetical protein